MSSLPRGVILTAWRYQAEAPLRLALIFGGYLLMAVGALSDDVIPQRLAYLGTVRAHAVERMVGTGGIGFGFLLLCLGMNPWRCVEVLARPEHPRGPRLRLLLGAVGCTLFALCGAFWTYDLLGIEQSLLMMQVQLGVIYTSAALLLPALWFLLIDFRGGVIGKIIARSSQELEHAA